MRAFLAALWQGDSAFPSGGFAFSNGLEGVAALGASLDRAGLAAAMETALRFRWATTDRVALLHAFAADDLDRVVVVDRAVEAATLPETFRTGSRRNGQALLITHARLATPGAAELKAAVTTGRTPGHLPVVQGWVWRRCGLDAQAAVATAAYTVAAGLANAAVRLGCLGAIDAQAALGDSLGLVAELAHDAYDPSSLRLSSMTPWLDVAATRHTRSELRLFSN